MGIMKNTMKGKALVTGSTVGLKYFNPVAIGRKFKKEWRDIHIEKTSEYDAAHYIDAMSEREYKQSVKYYAVRSLIGFSGMLAMLLYITANYSTFYFLQFASFASICASFFVWTLSNRFRVWQLKNKKYGSFLSFLVTPKFWWE